MSSSSLLMSGQVQSHPSRKGEGEGEGEAEREREREHENENVLVVCDMQGDVLNSILPKSAREALMYRIAICISVAQRAGWRIVYTGVCFPKNYDDNDDDDDDDEDPSSSGSKRHSSRHNMEHHKIYGGIIRLFQQTRKRQQLAAMMPGGNSTAATCTASSFPQWFTEGHAGTEIVFCKHDDKTSPTPDSKKKETIVWRRQHLPNMQDLVDAVTGNRNRNDNTPPRTITAHVVGIKAAYAVQAVVQTLCDACAMTSPNSTNSNNYNNNNNYKLAESIITQVNVVRECIHDNDMIRCEAMLQHLLPIYATIISISDFVDKTVGLDNFQITGRVPAQKSKHYDTKSVIKESAAKASDNESWLEAVGSTGNPSVKYYTDCGRAGHFFLFLPHLQKQRQHSSDNELIWQSFPTQRWYEESWTGKSYACPLGQKVVDFCDEPRFSKTSMYIKGREWLDEKDLILELAREFMPKTFRLEHTSWVGDDPTTYNSSTNNSTSIPTVWFLKETDKNGGRAVDVCTSIEECLALARPDGRYVIQPHLMNPLLTREGKKCHVKLYGYLQCSDGATVTNNSSKNDGESQPNQEYIWDLFSYTTAFLSMACQPWSPTDPCSSRQITTLRDRKLTFTCINDKDTNSAAHVEPSCPEWPGWSCEAQKQCLSILASVVERAIKTGRLEPRPRQKQFEIFSTDFMMNESGQVQLIEFNFTPVLYDPIFQQQELTTKGLREYHRRYHELEKDDPSIINDHDMIAEALVLALAQETGPPGQQRGQDQKPVHSSSSSSQWYKVESFTSPLLSIPKG